MKHHSPQEAAEFLTGAIGRRITINTLRNWRAQGRGPKVKYFGRWPVYEAADLEAFVTQAFDERPGEAS